MNPDSATLHLHRFAVESALPFPSDPSCRSEAVSETRDRLKISVLDFASLPCQLATVQKKEFYDLGDSALIWVNGFGMQLDLEARSMGIYLPPEGDYWPRATITMLNVGLSAASYFRGELPLHAGAVSLDGHFVGVLAASGTGKSTLVWSLIQHGALFGNDDLLNVALDGETPMAMPSVSLYPKLCAPSLEACADETPYVETYPDSGEFWMHIRPDQRLTEPQPLRALFALEPDDAATQISARRWGEARNSVLPSTDLETVFHLRSHLHGPQFGRTFVGAQKLEARLRQLAKQTPVYSLRYPKRFDKIPLLIETMRSLVA